MGKNDSKKMMRKLKYMRKIKTYLIILLISFFFVLTISAENKVAGIELKQHFTNLNSVDYFDSEVRYTYVPINFFFGKSKVKIPSSFFTKFTCFYTCMEAQNDEWIVSLLNKGFREYDYSNVYWEDSKTINVDFYAKYYNLCLELPIFGTKVSRSSQSRKLLIAQIGPLYPSTMYFEEVHFNFANLSLQSVEPETTLTSFNGNCPTGSFINNLSTDVVVKVISPNNPHYHDYCDYINGGNNISSVSTNVIDWSQYATEVTLKSGELFVMPDSNNFIHVNANFSGDEDGDTLSNAEEIFLYGTDPTDSDTDCDGLADNIEVSDHNIVLQFPGGDEIITINTMPTWYDTDGDGITDGDEVLGLYPYITNGVESHYVTNPCSDDTDDDGLTDDIDPHPLDPCNAQGATSINAYWMSYWLDIAQKAGINITDLSDPYADSDMDGVNNLNEMINKTNPIFTNGFRKILFEPEDIHFNLTDNTKITNFYLNVFSSGIVTGAVYISSLDWEPLLEMDGFSVFWEECPLDNANTTFLTYRVDNYKRLNFVLLLDHSKMNNAVRIQDVQVVDIKGPYSEQLTLFWDAEDGETINHAPSKPILLEPANGSDLLLDCSVITENTQEYEDVNFVWTASEDQENETINYTFNLYLDNLELVYSQELNGTNIAISTENFDFYCGYYYWQVVAEDSSHNKRNSNMGIFFIIIPGDRDDDGYDDYKEIKRGYDPDDPLDYPLTIVDDELEDATVGKEYFYRLKAVGGKKKKYSWIAFNEDDLPAGLRLNPEGELRGVPSETGEYQIRISVCDGKDIADKDLNITILPARDGLILKPGEGKVELRD